MLLRIARGVLDRNRAAIAFWELQDSRQLMAWLVGLALRGLEQFAWWIPAGVFLAFGVAALAARRRPAEQPLRATTDTGQHATRGSPLVWLLSTTIGIALAAVLAWIEAGYFVALDLLPPAVGCLLGAWIGVELCRGRSARRWLPVKLAGLLGLVVIALGVMAWLAIEPAPLPFSAASVTSDEKRRLVSLIRSRSPQRLGAGQTQTLRLSDHDVNVLLAWGLSLGSSQRKASVRLDDNLATLSVSLGLPTGAGAARYLNVSLAGRVSVEDGLVRLRAARCRMGRIETPGWLLSVLSPLIESKLGAERSLRPVFQAVRSMLIQAHAIELTYGRVEFPAALRAEVFGSSRVSDEVLAATRVHVRRLLDATGNLPGGDQRFGACMEVAFSLARERSVDGDPLVENRAAVFALGALLGHARVEEVIGDLEVRASDQPARQSLAGVSVRRRTDWTKHFWVSAAIALLSAESVSDAAGLLKEELDAGRGGSGFSFADLLADRAGTTFALTATRDESAARAMQERLAAGFNVDDYFPPAADFPERIPDAELQSRYGGVGGQQYLELVAEIERRVANCGAYR